MIPRPDFSAIGPSSCGSRVADMVRQRFAPEDEARRAWLNAQCFGEDPDEATEPLPPLPPRETCARGHLFDGVKRAGTRTRRYCKTCNAERMAERRAVVPRRRPRRAAGQVACACGNPLAKQNHSGVCMWCQKAGGARRKA